MDNKEEIKEDKYQFSQILLSLFLIVVGIGASYLLISLFISSEFNLLFLIYIPTFLFVGVLPLGYGLYNLFFQLKLLFTKGK